MLHIGPFSALFFWSGPRSTIWKVNLEATTIKNEEKEGDMDDRWEWADGVSALHVVSLDKWATVKQDVSIPCKFPRATYTGRGNCIMYNPQLTYVICSVWPGAVDLITHCGSTVPAGNSSTSLHYIYSSWKKRTMWCNKASVLFFFCAKKPQRFASNCCLTACTQYDPHLERVGFFV